MTWRPLILVAAILCGGCSLERMRVNSLTWQAKTLHGQGKFEEGLKVCQETLPLARALADGKDDMAVVDTLFWAARHLEGLERFSDALPAYEEVLAIRSRLHNGQDHPDAAWDLGNVASCLQSLGRSDEALSRYEAALAIRRRISRNADQAEVAVAIDHVAGCLRLLGRSEEALPMFEESLAMTRRMAKAPDSANEACSLNNLAQCLDSLGRYAEAGQKFEEAEAMFRRVYKGQDNENLAINLNNIGCFLDSLGRYSEGLPKLEESVAIYQRLARRQDPAGLPLTLDNLASCLDELGHTGEALSRHEEALAMFRRIHEGRDHPNIATCLINVACCLNTLGRHAEALPKFEEALAMDQRIYKGRDHPSLANSIKLLGYCLYGLDRTSEALPKAEEALAMHRRIHRNQDHPDVPDNLDNVANCLDSLTRCSEALPKYEESLAMRRRLFRNQDHPGLVLSLSNVASCLDSLDRDADALARYEEAMAMCRRLNASTYRSANLLGRLLLKMGRPEQAAPMFEEAITSLELARRNLGGSDQDRLGFFSRYLGQGGMYGGMARAQIALGHPDLALEYLDRGRSRSLLDVLERGQRLMGQDLLAGLESKVKAEGSPAALERVHAAQRKMHEAENRVNELTARINAARARSAEAPADTSASAAASRPGPPRPEGVQDLAAGLDKAQDAFSSARREAFNLAWSLNPDDLVFDLKPMTARQVQQLLAAGQRMLVYSIGDKDAVLILVGAEGQGIRTYSLKWPDGKAINGKSLNEAVSQYVLAILQDGRNATRGVERTTQPATDSLASLPEMGKRLFEALMPAEAWAQIKDAPLVYVVPDGAINRLPLETLVVKQEPAGGALSQRAYWLDAGPPLVYGQSATVLGKLLTRARAGDAASKPAHELVALGDPVFERTDAELASLAGDKSDPNTMGNVLRAGPAERFGRLSRLKGTREEVERIGKAFADKATVVSLLDERATNPNLFKEAQGTRYLHLATHGVMEGGDRAIYSGLALTQPVVATPQDTGFLTLMNLFNSWWGRLGQTELVVLSACDSQGLDREGRNLQPGEGVQGLPWGFMYAGGRALIVSLWEVDDSSTAQMMGDLYAGLKRDGKVKAFLDVRKDVRKSHPQPFFWAPFIYIGDPR